MSDVATSATIASLRAEVAELRERYDSLTQSIITACTGSGCLNAHELRVALDTARERAGVLEAEVRAWREPNGYLDLVYEVKMLGKEIDHTTLLLAMAIVDRTHALDAEKFGKEQNNGEA